MKSDNACAEDGRKKLAQQIESQVGDAKENAQRFVEINLIKIFESTVTHMSADRLYWAENVNNWIPMWGSRYSLAFFHFKKCHLSNIEHYISVGPLSDMRWHFIHFGHRSIHFRLAADLYSYSGAIRWAESAAVHSIFLGASLRVPLYMCLSENNSNARYVLYNMPSFFHFHFQKGTMFHAFLWRGMVDCITLIILYSFHTFDSFNGRIRYAIISNA